MTLEIRELGEFTTGSGAGDGSEGDCSQTFVSLEQLAIGVAHELNMPIQYVADSLQFLNMAFNGLMAVHSQYQKAFKALGAKGTPGVGWEEVALAEANADLDFLREQVPKAFERSVEGVEVIAGMVQAMKAFARPRRSSKAPADINRALLQMLALSRNEYKYVATVTTQLGDLPPVVCHIGDLCRVFLSIVVNAASSIAAARGQSEELGQILVRTVHQDNTVLIEMEHRGIGWTGAARSKFDPSSVTTGEPGAYARPPLEEIRSVIVDDHAGTYVLASDSEHAATSVIRLPVDEKCRVRTEDLP